MGDKSRGRVGLALVLVVASCTSSPEPATTTLTTTSAPPSTVPGSTVTSSTTVPPLPADTVLINGKVVTVDSEFTIAEAVAITDGDIVAVGSSSELAPYIGPSTMAVDLGGKTVLPGFIDPHTHTIQHLAFDSNIEAMKQAQQSLLAGGTTTTGAPTVTPADLAGYEAFEAAGEVIIRSHLYLAYNDPCGDRVDDDFYLQRPFDHDPELRQTIAGVKIFADGGVCNAPALSDVYPETVPEGLKERGFVGHGALYVTPEEVASVVSEVDSKGGITVIHAIGDEGIRTALSGLSIAYDSKPFSNHQRIDHNSMTTLLSDEEMSIYQKVGMIPVLFSLPYGNGCDPASTDAWRSILPASVFPIIEDSAALRTAYPELRFSWHGDAPSIPGQPLQLMFSFVTTGAVDIDSGTVCYPEAWADRHTVGIEEAIRMFTINAAAAMGIADRVGSIEVGKVADLIVLAEDPLGPDPEAGIATNHPMVTMIDGKVYFCDSDQCEQFQDLLAQGLTGAEPPVEGLTVTASSFRDVHTPELVFDGLAEGESFWSSGADPPGWIQVDLTKPATVTGLRFVVFQNPPSDTVHLLEIRQGGSWIEVERFTGFTTTGDVLEWVPADPQSGVEGFRITTLESLSWPEWYEVEILYPD